MFRFTIRDVMWLTAVVGLSAAWISEHIRVGHSPGQLSTLIEVLAAEGIRVALQPNRIQVQGSAGAGTWHYDVGVGEAIPKAN